MRGAEGTRQTPKAERRGWGGGGLGRKPQIVRVWRPTLGGVRGIVIIDSLR